MAVICVGLTTTILVCVSPPPCSLTCDAGVKFVPVSVTLTDVPRAPLEGVDRGQRRQTAGAVYCEGRVSLVPPVVVTEILCCPGAGVCGNVERRGDLRAADDGHIRYRNTNAGDSDGRRATKPVPARVTGRRYPGCRYGANRGQGGGAFCGRDRKSQHVAASSAGHNPGIVRSDRRARGNVIGSGDLRRTHDNDIGLREPAPLQPDLRRRSEIRPRESHIDRRASGAARRGDRRQRR